MTNLPEQINFYRLEKTSCEKFLPKLLEKIYGQKQRTVLLAENKEKIDHLNHLLWTYTPISFLPHASAQDGNATEQPIWLTDTLENPNNAQILVITGGRKINISDNIGFKKILYLFSPYEISECATANIVYNNYKENNMFIVFWKQKINNKWEKSDPNFDILN
jgi:DNA polymerase III subunit chi